MIINEVKTIVRWHQSQCYLWCCSELLNFAL